MVLVDLDAALGEEFFDIAVRQPVAEVPAHCQQDHVGWNRFCANDGAAEW